MNTQKIALLADSGSDVPKEYITKYHVYTLPLKIIYGEKVYTDGVDITANEVYSKLATEIPTTSLPSGEDILKIFDQIKADGYEKLLVITISSGLSGTNNLVNLMAKDYEDLDICVIDTKSIGIGSGLTAVEAAKNIANEMPWEELKAKTARDITQCTVFFCISTLEYLQKGGRIGLVASMLGNMLNLKPIISCNEDGIYYNVAKVRGRKKSLEATMEYAIELASKCKKCNIALANGGAEEEVSSLKNALLAAIPNCQEFYEGQISPALGVHTGPGLIGIGVQVLE